jgi:hypothetical protein
MEIPTRTLRHYSQTQSDTQNLTENSELLTTLLTPARCVLTTVYSSLNFSQLQCHPVMSHCVCTATHFSCRNAICQLLARDGPKSTPCSQFIQTPFPLFRREFPEGTIPLLRKASFEKPIQTTTGKKHLSRRVSAVVAGGLTPM